MASSAKKSFSSIYGHKRGMPIYGYILMTSAISIMYMKGTRTDGYRDFHIWHIRDKDNRYKVF